MICLKWSIVRPSPLICSSYCLVFSETIAVLVPRPLATVKRDSKFIHFLIGFKRQEHKVCWCKFEILPPAMASRSKQTPTLFQQFWELFWALPINVHFLFYIKSCLQFSLRCQPIKLWIIFFNKAQLLWCSTHQYLIVQLCLFVALSIIPCSRFQSQIQCSLFCASFQIILDKDKDKYKDKPILERATLALISPDYAWPYAQNLPQIAPRSFLAEPTLFTHLLFVCSVPIFPFMIHLFGSPQKWGTGLLICLQIQRKICFHDKGTFHIG